MDDESSRYDMLENVILDANSEPCIIPLQYLRKITSNFSDDQLLGEGGFGKGVLQNGKMIAVKKFNHQAQLVVQERQFENEVYHLMKLKHPNIVRFVGYCYETLHQCVEHNGKYIFAEMQQQRLLCLEYLPNGSLDRHLSDGSSRYDWKTRYKIIKGIFCGLHYLHEECLCEFSASIIHLDLKPANILLDVNMVPKVADFDLSRLFEDNKTHTCATSLLGSLGYMAPEYLIGRIVTTKADIYNLGVIIIEIIAGQKGDVFNFSSRTYYKDFVERVLESWRNRNEGPPSETDCKQIETCLEIGISCVKLYREERPTIREIIERLDRWENTNCYFLNNDENSPAEQADITGTGATAGADNAGADNDDDTGGAHYGSPSWTRVRGLSRGLLSFLSRLFSDSEEMMGAVSGHAVGHASGASLALETNWFPMSAAASGTLWEDDDSVSEQESVQSSFKDPAEEFTFAQLEAATKGFALEAKIGEGSFGAVYHGKLPDGREVAIKRDDSGRRARWFQESALEPKLKLALVSHLNHKHLVGLVGYCEVNEELLLVYEYAQNGALCDHLHPKATATPSASPPSPVVSSWKLRIKILLDASRGIEYLHSYPELPQIHGEIKSSNILLDAEWTARVSDFGLPLMDSEEQVAAHLTEKTDVYSFGLVMLEVLTGFDDEADDGGRPAVSLVDYAVPSIVAGELGKVLDPRAPEPAAHEAEAVGLVAYAAVHCVCLEGKDRPAMAAIVASLETALSLCEGSCGGDFGSSRSSASV